MEIVFWRVAHHGVARRGCVARRIEKGFQQSAGGRTAEKATCFKQGKDGKTGWNHSHRSAGHWNPCVLLQYAAPCCPVSKALISASCLKSTILKQKSSWNCQNVFASNGPCLYSSRHVSCCSEAMKCYSRTPSFVILFALLLSSVAFVHGGSIYVPNYSFESQQTSFADPRVDSWQKPDQPVGFDTNTFGAWDNLAGVFYNDPSTNNSDYISNADGSQLAFLFAYPQMALFQDYNSTDWSNGPPTHAFNARYEVGKSYRLTVGLTSSSQEPLTQGSTLQLSLYYRDASSNMVTVAQTTVTYDTNLFTNLDRLIDFSVVLTNVQSTDPWAGQNIGIQFMSTVQPQLIGGVWDLDNVRLTEKIYVPNFSFESQQTSFADPRVDSWQKPDQPVGFDTNTFGAWDNLAGVFYNDPSTNNSDYISNADGSQLAFLFAYPQMALFQDYNSTDWSNGPPTHAFNARYEVGKSYRLTVGLTSSSQEPLTQGSTLQLSLYYRDASSNMVTVAQTTVTYDTNLFTNLDRLIDFSVVLTNVQSTDPWAGQNIGIQFMSTVQPQLIGGVWDLDNVRLVDTVATVLMQPRMINGQFSFTLKSEPNLPFAILGTTNITQPASGWVNITTLTNTSGSFQFTEPATNLTERFYRARRL